jgi:hypothetical protein
MQRLITVASPPGLYAEEFDAETGRHLGNFPQAFSTPGGSRGRGANRPSGSPGGDHGMSNSYDVVVIGSGAGGGTLLNAEQPHRETAHVA